MSASSVLPAGSASGLERYSLSKPKYTRKYRKPKNGHKEHKHSMIKTF